MRAVQLLDCDPRLAQGLSAEEHAVAAGSLPIVGLEERLLILLWHLAERWGEPVKEGIRIPIGLPHRLLAELVGARRPSVTTALTSLQEEGRLTSAANGCWVLLGDPPC